MTESGLSAIETEVEIHLYGWNDQGGFWHGPTEIEPAAARNRRHSAEAEERSGDVPREASLLGARTFPAWTSRPRCTT